MGYVGCVTGACLAELGHNVLGVDVNPQKVAMINNGQSPIIEKDINEIIKRVVKAGRFTATINQDYAIEKSEIAMICVGTPSKKNGSLDLEAIQKVSEEIGTAIMNKNEYFVVINRSTVLPGTIESIILPLLEKYSGKLVGKDFGLCMNPEFLREGSSVYDFYHPPKNVIGEYDQRSGDLVADIYKTISCTLIRTEIKIAEMIKYTDNCFHALKVTFANEIGNICKELDIDSHKVMEIFCSDTKLNLSSYYLKPGFAFGGSCLPKDLRALTYKSKTLDIETPVLNSILHSNKEQINKTISLLLDLKPQKIGFLGLSFKEGTDDLRESPIVEVIETIIGKGMHVGIYDKNVFIAKLIGSNKEYIEKGIPHISSLMYENAEKLIEDFDVIVIGNKSDEFVKLIQKMKRGQTIIDLVRITEDRNSLSANYYGICW
jgi:GDP-mannose 6-dehydrogenase